jgi:integrase/recombinase XerD
VHAHAAVRAGSLTELRVFEATGCDIEGLSEVHGHRVLRVHGKGYKVVLTPLPPAAGRAVDRAAGDRLSGPILLSRSGTCMTRHVATRRLLRLAQQAGLATPRMHPRMLRQTFVTTMLDAGVDLRDVQIAAHHADPRTTMRYDRARKNLDRHPPTTSSLPTWLQGPDSGMSVRSGCGAFEPPLRRASSGARE